MQEFSLEIAIVFKRGRAVGYFNCFATACWHKTRVWCSPELSDQWFLFIMHRMCLQMFMHCMHKSTRVHLSSVWAVTCNLSTALFLPCTAMNLAILLTIQTMLSLLYNTARNGMDWALCYFVRPGHPSSIIKHMLMYWCPASVVCPVL